MLTLQSKLIGAILLGTVLWIGYEWIGAKAVQEYKDEVAVAQAEADKAQREKYNKLSEDFEALKTKRQENAKIVTKQVETVITRDVYRNTCIDSDGLRIINDAIKGANSGELKTEMPSAATD
jgi:hypothetical protein